MIRTLRPLSLALLAVFAMSASIVSVASADPSDLHSDGDFTTLTGTQVGASDALKFDAGTLTCKKATYTGTTNATSTSTFAVTPSHSECELTGVGQATVSINGCTYTFIATESEGETIKGSTSIDCPEGKELTVVVIAAGVTKCTLHIPPQGPLTGITYTNATSGGRRDITVDLNLSGIKYSQTVGTGAGKCTTLAGTENGAYQGQITFTGDNEAGETTDIWAGEETGDFHSDGDWTIFKGVQTEKFGDQFVTDAGIVTCEQVSYTGSTSATATTTLSVQPTYSNCEVKGVGVVDITVGTCEYEFDSSANQVRLNCPSGEVVVVMTASGVTKCTIKIPTQAFLGGIQYTNGTSGATGKKDVTVDVSIATGIAYSQTAGTGAGKCATASSTTNGSYEGQATVSGDNTSNSATDIEVS